MKKSLAGWLAFTALVWYVLATFLHLPLFPSAALCWLTVLLIWPSLNRTSQIQSGSLFLIGSVLLAISYYKLGHIDWSSALQVNLPLMMMFAAVAFLTSKRGDSAKSRPLPTGKKGALSTLATCHVIGGVINFSILFIVADKLSEKKPLSAAQAALIARGFSGAALWSPFFMGGAVALSYSPGAHIGQYILAGVLMVVPLTLITLFETSRNKHPDIAGYPLNLDSLILPAVLSVAVIAGHYAFPSVSTIFIITVIAPITAMLFTPRGGKRAKAVEVVREKLPKMSGQYALFLAAGVFSVGISATLQQFSGLDQHLPAHFNALGFLLVGIGMTIVALVGVHPLISISLLSPFLLYMKVDPNEMVFLFVSAWSISTAISPLSSVGLTLTEHYQVNKLDYMRAQCRYAVLMWLSATLVAYLFF
ncbi:hypothetical protein L4C34_17170 [Vibrio profundum]|uniref:hypothetical protein n=1 Tax=Vibrio profundum TaxID=2910247 RepID=UPI003D1418CC